jgi:hypothetical protein
MPLSDLRNARRSSLAQNLASLLLRFRVREGDPEGFLHERTIVVHAECFLPRSVKG